MVYCLRENFSNNFCVGFFWEILEIHGDPGDLSAVSRSREGFDWSRESEGRSIVIISKLHTAILHVQGPTSLHIIGFNQ